MRRFKFDGNDADYITFLEDTILESSRVIQTYKTFLSDRNGHSPHARERCPTLFQKRSSPFCQDDEGRETKRLKIIEYNPHSQGNSTTPANSEKEYRWQRELKQMLERIPSLDFWENERSNFPLVNETILKAAVNHEPFLMDLSLNSKKFPHTRDVIVILRHYCSFTKGVISEANISQKTASFMELIFVSLCAVALKTVEDAQRVYGIMRLYVSDARQRHLDKLIRGAIWANQSISALSKTDWGTRAAEVFLIGKNTAAFQVNPY